MRKITLVIILLMLIGVGLLSGCTEQPASQTKDENQSPIVTCSANPTRGTAPLTVNFFGSGIDPEETNVSYKWYFDDGTTSTEQNPSHTFQSANMYIVTFTVEDTNGGKTTKTLTISVTQPSSNEKPPSLFSASPTSGIAPLVVTFIIHANNTNGSISSWKLDANNDGISDYFGSGNPPSEKQYTYTDPGKYIAQLTLTVNESATMYDTITITVYSTPSEPPTP